MRDSRSIPAALLRPAETALTDKAAWSLDDAAKATSLSTRMIQKLVKDGVMPHGRIGRRLIFDPPTIRQWIASRCGAVAAAVGSPNIGATSEGGATR